MIVVVRRILPRPGPGRDAFLGDLLRRETVGGALALRGGRGRRGLGELAVGGVVRRRCGTWQVGPLDLEHWAADGALTLFFFVAGLELKREFVVGSLRRPADAAVPVVAAAVRRRRTGADLPGGQRRRADGQPGGWAIPAATDIAFALAVLAVVGLEPADGAAGVPADARGGRRPDRDRDHRGVLHLDRCTWCRSRCRGRWRSRPGRCCSGCGSRTPLRLRAARGARPGGACTRAASTPPSPGVALGLLTRVRPDAGEEHSPAERLEHLLSPVSSGVAVPFFALMSAGVVLAGGGDLVRDPVVIGVVARARASASRSACFGGRLAGHPVHPRRAQRRRSAGATSSASPCSPASASPSRCWSPTCRSRAPSATPPRPPSSPAR